MAKCPRFLTNFGDITKASIQRVYIKKDILLCYLISDASICVQCGNVFLESGHKILAVVSNNREVTNWAKKNNIEVLNSVSKLTSRKKDEVDYLFSIYNTSVLSEEVINLPKICSINYHDSLLPKYAGVHATSWAILNGEKETGVSWHIMNLGVNSGNILEQAKIAIDDYETVFALNLRVYQYVIDSFGRLVKKLEKNQYDGIAQNLKKRSYFSRYQTPDSFGFANFAQSGEVLCKLSQALNFGRYQNRFCSFKICFGNKIYFPLELKLLSKKGKEQPGTITKLGNDYIQCSTLDSEVQFSNLLSIDAEKLSIAELKECEGLKVGQTMEAPCKIKTHRLQELSKQLMPHENYWINQLKHVRPLKLGFVFYNSKANDSKNTTLSYSLCRGLDVENITNDFGDSSAKEVLASISLMYLYKILNKTPFSVGLHGFQKLPASNFIQEILPTNWDFSDKQTYREFFNFVKNYLSILTKKISYLSDVQIRNPQVDLSKKELILLSFNPADELSDDRYPIQILVDEIAGEVVLKVKHSPSERVQEIIDSFSDDFNHIVQSFVKYPESIFTRDANKLSRPLDKNNSVILEVDENIVDFFEKRVKLEPDAIALTEQNNSITFANLNIMSNQLAHFLVNIGIKRDTPVILCLNRSIQTFIAIFGVLKAGGAYIPVVQAIPKKWLQKIIDDSKAPIVITDRVNLENISNDHLKILCLEDITKKILEQEQSNPKVDITPSQLAYILYTSGSTGEPKGVLVEHSNLSQYLVSANMLYPFIDGPALFLASIAFDMSITTLFLPLIRGQNIHILPEDGVIESLVKELEIIDNFSLLKITPTHLKALKPFFNPKAFRGKGLLIVGGEKLFLNDVIDWVSNNSQFSVYNEYGPTEGTVGCIAHRITEDDKDTIIPIGKPLQGVYIYLLDENFNPVGKGKEGKIFIGGKNVARGYLNKPSQTAQKFILNPFLSKQADDSNFPFKLYRTDDLAKYNVNGDLVFLERNDSQIKIRGCRVELDEIENALTKLEIIGSAYIYPAPLAIGDIDLKAYLVPANLDQHKRNTREITELNSVILDEEKAQIKNTLRSLLPSYMIPSSFCFVNYIPFNKNGKVDIKKLLNLSKNEEGLKEISSKSVEEEQFQI